MITAATSPGVLGEQALHVGDVAGLRLERVEQERLVHRVEEVDAAHGHGADRVAVVGHLRARRSRAPVLPALAPVLERHLERDLGGRGAGVRVEDAREAGRRELHQPLRQLDRRAVAQAEHRGVRDLRELVANGGVDARVRVAVNVAPQRRDAVDVAVAVDVDQVGALAALDDHRVLLGPAALLGERMPEIAAVGGCQVHRGARLARGPDVGSPVMKRGLAAASAA